MKFKQLMLLSLAFVIKSQLVWAVDIEILPVRSNSHSPRNDVCRVIKVGTLNLAHGRGQALNQIFVSKKKTKENLEDIAHFFLDEEIDVVAVQEADVPSLWSGNFDHVEFLAHHGEYPQFVQTAHAKIILGNYGTAVLSRRPVKKGFGISFPSTPPTAKKGFTLAELEWETTGGVRLVDVISVHLDFSREKVRKGQVAEIVTFLSERKNPIVLMGDLNSELIAEYLLNNQNTLRFHTIEDEGGLYNTYKKKRLDWIILTSELKFLNYRVIPVKFSDHMAVVAEISFSDTENDK